jgi:ubiquinone/menaquinone biosynthesis C-methylase UbiE
MDHYQEIYAFRSMQYHRMITVEDVDGNLLPAIERIAPIDDNNILDLGSGTGRLPLQFYNRAAHIVAFDLSAGMLGEQKTQQQKVDGDWGLVQGDIQLLPFPNRWADLTTAGWTIGHFQGWYPKDAMERVSQVLMEMQRVTKPGGAMIILETMTTGSLTPAPPTEALGAYYSFLEEQWGFTRQVIRTDYQCRSVDDAASLLGFFFGPGLVEKIRHNRWARVPEWTGVWGKVLKSAKAE